jgi:hypothetical protein
MSVKSWYDEILDALNDIGGIASSAITWLATLGVDNAIISGVLNAYLALVKLLGAAEDYAVTFLEDVIALFESDASEASIRAGIHEAHAKALMAKAANLTAKAAAIRQQ